MLEVFVYFYNALYVLYCCNYATVLTTGQVLSV